MAALLKAERSVFSRGVHYVTSKFGNRTYKNGNKTVSDFHNGIDLVAKNIAADHVIAFADGTVLEVLNNVTGRSPSQGNYVKLCHGNGINTVYYHLKAGSVTVKKGDRVKTGDVLGYMGSSGNSTGAHLHFGININGQWQDPEPYLTGKKSIGEKKAFEGGALSGINKARGSDELILYLNKKSTGTNKWGTEVQIDKRGVVLSKPVYGVGNMKIPSGGKVLSGHGLASRWILDNISEGDLVWFKDEKTFVAKGCHRSVENNCIRQKNSLVVYDEGEYANTNPYGFEVAVDKNSKALTAPVYGKGKMKIPDGGFVVSGHGDEGKWLYSRIKKGSKVEYNKSGGFIKVL